MNNRYKFYYEYPKESIFIKWLFLMKVKIYVANKYAFSGYYVNNESFFSP